MKIDMQHISCPLCSRDEPIVLYSTKDKCYGFDGIFSVVQCKHCAMVYTEPWPGREKLGYYYPKEYHQRHYATNGKRLKQKLHKLWLGFSPLYYFNMLKKEIGENTSLKKRLLDVGCGGGRVFILFEKTD